MRWLIFALSGAALFIYARAADLALLSLLTKGIPVIALLLWLQQAPAGTYSRWIRIGLFCALEPRRHLAESCV